MLLVDESPNKVVREGTGSKLKIKYKLVFRMVLEVNKGSADVEEVLSEIMTWLHPENGVHGHDIASSSREGEDVRVSILSCLAIARELLFVDFQVGVEPVAEVSGRVPGGRKA